MNRRRDVSIGAFVSIIIAVVAILFVQNNGTLPVGPEDTSNNVGSVNVSEVGAGTPTANDDVTRNVLIGEVYVDEAGPTGFVNLDNADGAAVWQEIGAGGGGGDPVDIETDNVLEQTDATVMDFGSEFDVNCVAGECDISLDAVDISDDTNLVGGIGITITGDSVAADLGVAIVSSEITDGTILEIDLAAVDVAADEECLTHEVTVGDFEWQECQPFGVSIDTGEITDSTILEADLAVVDSPVDEECLTFETTTGDFEWQTCGAGGAGVAVTGSWDGGVGNTEWELPGVVVQADNTNALTADDLMNYPIFVLHDITVNTVGFEVTSAGIASSLARVCVFEATENWQPATLVKDWGTVLVDSTGEKEIGDGGGPMSLTAAQGRYIIQLISDDAPTTRVLRGSPITGSIVANGFGANPYKGRLLASGQATQIDTGCDSDGVDWTGGNTSSSAFEYAVFFQISDPSP